MPQLVSKPLAFFKINPQVRKSFDEADLRRLGESLKVKQLQPVLCQPDGTLIAGERRYRAAKLVGLATLEVKIADEQMTEPELRRWQLVENMLREDLKPSEQVDGLEELARLNPEMNNKDRAGLLNIDPSMVTRLRSVGKVIPAVRDALAAGTIGISDAYAISKLPEPQMAGMLELRLSGASRDTIEHAGRKSRNGAATAVKLSKARLALASGVLIVVSGPELSLDELIESLVQAAKEAKQARDQGLDIKTMQAVFRDKAKQVQR